MGKQQDMTTHPAYGDSLKFCEPSWYQGLPSPYYKQTHVDFRAKCREFVEKEIVPYADEWDKTGYPRSLHRKSYEAGIHGAIYPVEYGGTPPPDFDAFHEIIMNDEIARSGCGGILAQASINSMALPPIIQHASQRIKDMVLRDVITGKKDISLAISEPTHGSDVAGLRTTAVRDGDHY